MSVTVRQVQTADAPLWEVIKECECDFCQLKFFASGRTRPNKLVLIAKSKREKEKAEVFAERWKCQFPSQDLPEVYLQVSKLK